MEANNSILNKADTASVGLEMGGYVVAGYFLGAWLDGVFETTPWLTVVYLLLGAFAAGRSLWRVARKYQRVLRRQATTEARSARMLTSGRWSGGNR